MASCKWLRNDYIYNLVYASTIASVVHGRPNGSRSKKRSISLRWQFKEARAILIQLDVNTEVILKACLV